MMYSEEVLRAASSAVCNAKAGDPCADCVDIVSVALDIAVPLLRERWAQELSECEESNQVWREVSQQVCEAAGVAQLVQVPAAFTNLRERIAAEIEEERGKWLIDRPYADACREGLLIAAHIVRGEHHE